MLIKEVVFVLLFGISVLLFVSNFVESLGFIQKIGYTLFGVGNYIWPIVIVVTAWLFLFTEINGLLFTRVSAVLLFLFALSGIFSLAMEVPDGGLLGRGNYAMFTGWLGRVGTYIVNAVLLAVAMILFTGFSISQAFRNMTERSEEEQLLREKESELQKERKALRKQESAARKTAREMERLQRMEQENEEIRERTADRLLRDEKNRERFRPIYGIGDTTIRATDTPVKSSFSAGDSEDALHKNRRLFTNYSNSGSGLPKNKETVDPESFIPAINIPSEFFGDEEEEQKEVKEKPKKTHESAEIKAPEDPEPEHIPYELDKDDEYVKTVITSTGKIITNETDGDILSRKEIIHAGEKPASALSQEKAANTPTAEAQAEIVREIGEPQTDTRQKDGRSLRTWQEDGYSVTLLFDAQGLCLGVEDEHY